MDIFYEIKNKEERDIVQEIGYNNGYVYYGYGKNKIFRRGFDYMVFTTCEKLMYTYYKTEHITLDDLIDYSIEYNDGEYQIATNIDELNLLLENINKPYFMRNIINIYESSNINIREIYYVGKDLFYVIGLGKKYGFNDIKWFCSDDPNFIIFSLGANGEKEIYLSYTRNIDEYIKTYEDENNGYYVKVDNLKDLEYYLKYGVKMKNIDTINKRRNIYENKIFNFDDFQNLEYRKGSSEYGGILIKLLEFLRLYNVGADLSFNISDFTNYTNISMNDIKKLIESKNKGQKLYDFDIQIDNNIITFIGINKTGKNRPFESINL